jgi:hypothetical protein
VFVFRKPPALARAEPALSALSRSEPVLHIQTTTLDLMPAETPSAPPAEAADGGSSSAAPAEGIDIEDLVERITRRLSRQLAIEHERRGSHPWR